VGGILPAVAAVAVLAVAIAGLVTGTARGGRRPSRARTLAVAAAALRPQGPKALPPPRGDLLPPGPLAEALAALQAAYVDVVRRVEPSVVQITTAGDLGSGVILDRRGDIVTNNHVVNGAHRVTVTLSDGRTLPGRVLGTDRPDDLAVVRIRATGLRPARFAGRGEAQAGAIVLAVGNPLGFQSSVSVGIVSAVGRSVTEPDGVTLTNAVQTSAEINPGNSGGALVDLAGRVVGVPTLVALNQQQGGVAPGIGFAVPSATVTAVALAIVRHGRVGAPPPAFAGLVLGDIVDAAGAPAGVLVTDVQKGSAAARAGVRPQDIVVAVGGHPTLTAGQLVRALAALGPGRAARVTVLTPGGRRRRLILRQPAGRRG